MIVDTLENASRYYMLHPAFEMAMDFLEQYDVDHFKPGQVELSGQDVFVNAMERDTVAEENAIWESHDSYMDIHFTLDGSELMQLGEEENMKVDVPYDEAKDCTFFKGGRGLDVFVPKGGFVVFFPGEIHKTLIADGSPAGIKKLVIKIKMD